MAARKKVLNGCLGLQLISIVITWALAMGGVQATSIQLSGEPKVQAVIRDSWLSPDGRWLVFLKDGDLYSRDVNVYSEPIKLNLPRAAQEIILTQGLTMTGDSKTILFFTQKPDASFNDLYRVPVAGGTALKLAVVDRFSYIGPINYFTLTPDEKNIIFYRDSALYRVPLAGGEVVSLTANLLPSGRLFPYNNPYFKVSPDGRWVYFRYGRQGETDNWLFRIATDGTTSASLTTHDADQPMIGKFQLSPQGMRIVYVQYAPYPPYPSSLKSILAGRGTPATLDTYDDNTNIDSYMISPDGQYVVYRKCYRIIQQPNTREFLYELRSVPIGGGTPVRLNPPLINGGSVAGDFQFSPDGTRVVFRADCTAKGSMELYSIPISGGTAVRLNAPISASGEALNDYEITPDGRKIIYRLDWRTTNTANSSSSFYIVPTGGGTARKLFQSAPGFAYGSHSMVIDPTGSRVICELIGNPDGRSFRSELYSLPLGSGTPAKLIASRGSTFYRWELCNQGQDVLVSTDWEYENVIQPYRIRISGDEPVNLAQGIKGPVRVTSFMVSPDRRRAVYRGNFESDLQEQLYSVPVGGGKPVRLSEDLDQGAQLGQYQITPDGLRVVYTVSPSGDIFSVPIAGGIASRLNPILEQGEKLVFNFDSNSLFRVDNTRVYCWTEISVGGGSSQYGIYVLPISGGAPLHHIKAPTRPTLTADGQWVLYAVQRGTAVEIYKQSIAGTTATRLATINGYKSYPTLTLTPSGQYILTEVYTSQAQERVRVYSIGLSNGAVQPVTPELSSYEYGGYSVTPNSQHLIYYVQEVYIDELYESLYSVPLSGGTPVYLHERILYGTNGQKDITEVSPDGNYVVWLSNWKEWNWMHQQELHSELGNIPVRGGTSNIRSYPYGKILENFRITPDSTKIVCWAGNSLYVTPISGKSWLRIGGLSGTYSPGQFLAGSKAMVCRADMNGDGNWELVKVPLDGTPPVKVSGKAVGASLSNNFWASPDGGTYLYTADPGSGSQHLFASFPGIANGVGWSEWMQYP